MEQDVRGKLDAEFDVLLAEILDAITRRRNTLQRVVMDGVTMGSSTSKAEGLDYTSAASTDEADSAQDPPNGLISRHSRISIASCDEIDSSTLLGADKVAAMMNESLGLQAEHEKHDGMHLPTKKQGHRFLFSTSCSDTSAYITEQELARMQHENHPDDFSSTFGKDRADIETPQYRVENLYKTSGWSQAVARSSTFGFISLLVILCNAVFIGIDAEWNPASSMYGNDFSWFFTLTENAFCCFFTFELCVRFCSFANKLDSIHDGWFRIDCVLVFMMVLDAWILGPTLRGKSQGLGGNSSFKILRLLRITRLTRLTRSMPELVAITKSIIAGIRAVCSTFIFVALLTYCFGLVVHNLMKDEYDMNERLRGHQKLDTLPHCIWTLVMSGAFMEDTSKLLSPLVLSGNSTCVAAFIAIFVYILFASILVMNMLVGVLCEVVVRMTQAEKDDTAIRLMKESILLALKRHDEGDGLIDQEGVNDVMTNSQSRAILRALNVDRLFVTELQGMFFPHPESRVPIRSVMELMLLCRGELPLTVEHLAITQASLMTMLNQVVHHVNENTSRALKKSRISSRDCQRKDASRQILVHLQDRLENINEEGREGHPNACSVCEESEFLAPESHKEQIVAV